MPDPPPALGFTSDSLPRLRGRVGVGACALSNAGVFVRLQAELPLRMREAEADRPFGVLCTLLAGHRLHREAMKIEPGKVEWLEPLLRHDNLQLVPAGD